MVIMPMRNMVTYCHRWSHLSLARSRTSGVMPLMVIMALWPLSRNLSRRVRVRVRNGSLIDLLASPQVKTQLLLWCQQHLEINQICHPLESRSCISGSKLASLTNQQRFFPLLYSCNNVLACLNWQAILKQDASLESDTSGCYQTINSGPM